MDEEKKLTEFSPDPSFNKYTVGITKMHTDVMFHVYVIKFFIWYFSYNPTKSASSRYH